MYWVGFADNSWLKYELKAKQALSSTTSVSQTNDVINSNRSNMSSRVLGKRITCALTHCAFFMRNINSRWHTQKSCFFNIAANKADLTTNFNGNVWHFIITKSSSCLGKTYAKRICRRNCMKGFMIRQVEFIFPYSSRNRTLVSQEKIFVPSPWLVFRPSYLEIILGKVKNIFIYWTFYSYPIELSGRTF